jgi:cytochrome P450
MVQRAEPLPPVKPTGQQPRPAAPVPWPIPPGMLKRIRLLRDNPITAFAQRAYETPILELSSQRRRILLVSDPKAIEHILIFNARNYRKSEQQQRRLRPALGDGLLTAEGEAWRSGRHIAAPLFNPRAVALMYDDMRSAARAMSLRWQSRSVTSAPLDVAAEFQRLTYEIVSQTIFSGALDEDRAQIHTNMALYFDTLGRIDFSSMFNLPDWLPTRSRQRARPALLVFRDIVERVVQSRLANPQHNDLLDRLMHAPDPATGDLLAPQTVADNVLTFLAAGHETTANALTWIFYLLALFPETETRVLTEINQQPQDGLTGSSEGLRYTHAVVNESLRLYPPVPFIGREAVAEDEVAGQSVAPGTQILISPWIVHRHRRLWDAADMFLPERFMSTPAQDCARGSFIPFGLGPRICIGQGFALQEILVVLQEILPLFRFKLCDANAVFPQARITLHPNGGMPMVVSPRE